MRFINLILGLIVTLALPSEVQARYTKAFQYGAWEGLAFYRDDNGAFDFCAIAGEYKSGLTMYIALHPAGSWQLIFARKEGFNGCVSTFGLYVDEKHIYTG